MAFRRQQQRFVRWIDDRFPLFSAVHHQLYDYPMPRNLNYWWNFGIAYPVEPNTAPQSQSLVAPDACA